MTRARVRLPRVRIKKARMPSVRLPVSSHARKSPALQREPKRAARDAMRARLTAPTKKRSAFAPVVRAKPKPLQPIPRMVKRPRLVPVMRTAPVWLPAPLPIASRRDSRRREVRAAIPARFGVRRLHHAAVMLEDRRLYLEERARRGDAFARFAYGRELDRSARAGMREQRRFMWEGHREEIRRLRAAAPRWTHSHSIWRPRF
jgi:hypothetical protein